MIITNSLLTILVFYVYSNNLASENLIVLGALLSLVAQIIFFLNLVREMKCPRLFLHLKLLASLLRYLGRYTILLLLNPLGLYNIGGLVS